MPSTVSSSSAVSEILHSLFVLCKHLSLYHEKNTLVTTATDKLMKQLKACFHKDESIQVSVAKYSFLLNGEPLDPQNRLFANFAFRMFQHGIAAFSLTPELTVAELYAFLNLIMGKASSTWDQGGIGACMKQREVESIKVTEFSKDDFKLLKNTEDQQPLEQIQSSQEFWRRFARTLLSAVSGEDLADDEAEDYTPFELADKITQLLGGMESAEKNRKTAVVSQVMNQSVIAAQGQKLRSEQAATYLQLASFISHLGQDLRADVMAGVCNLQMLKNSAEMFFGGLSDVAILEAFKQVSAQRNYTSPVIMSLISKLADSRQVITAEDLALFEKVKEDRTQKARELLRADEFEKYVPERYRKTLLQMLSSQQTPQALSSHLQKLKTDLEDIRLEQQIANVSLYILEHSADQAYLPALHKQLAAAIDFFLASADYRRLIALCRRCFEGKIGEEIATLANLLPDSFYSQVLKDAARLGKNYHPLVNELIDLFGPAFAPYLLDEVNIETDRAARLLFLNNLRKIGPSVENISGLISSYLSDQRWYVIRNMLLLLGSLGSKEDLPKIRPFLEHNHQRVRQEAVKTCLLLKDISSLKQLGKSLASADREEVLHAVSLMGLVHIPELVDDLLSLLGEEKLLKFDFEVKKAAVQSLGKQREKRALEVFSRILKSRKLLHARNYNQLKLEIVKALQYYPADQAMPLLKQQASEGTGMAALQAKQIIQKLSGRSTT